MDIQIEIHPTLLINTKAGAKNAVDLIWLSKLLKEIGEGRSLIQASKSSGSS